MRHLIVATFVASVLTVTARAATMGPQATIFIGNYAGLGFTGQATSFDFAAAFPQFDPSLGALESVQLSFVVGISGTWNFINTDPSNVATVGTDSAIFGHDTIGYGQYKMQIDDGGNLTNCCGGVQPVLYGSPASGFDIPAGGSALFTNVSISTGRSTPVFTTGLGAFIGNGTFDLTGRVETLVIPNIPATVVSDPELTTSGVAYVTYTYDVPEPTSTAAVALGLAMLWLCRRHRQQPDRSATD